MKSKADQPMDDLCNDELRRRWMCARERFFDCLEGCCLEQLRPKDSFAAFKVWSPFFFKKESEDPRLLFLKSILENSTLGKSRKQSLHHWMQQMEDEILNILEARAENTPDGGDDCADERQAVRQEIAQRLLSDRKIWAHGFPYDDVARWTQLPKNEVEDLAKKLNVP